MEAILKLQQALIVDYYKTFIISIDEEEIDFNIYYSDPIIYRGKEYFEKDIISIKDEIKFIIEDIQPLYLNTLSEVLLKLGNLSSPPEKLNYLVYTVKLLSIPFNQLQKDFYLDKKESRYFSKPKKIDDYLSIQEVTEIIINISSKNLSIPAYEFDDLTLDEIYQYNKRLEILSFLPMALITVASSLMNILNNKIEEIKEQIEVEKSDELKLKWIGKPSQLGYLIGQLAQQEYIEPPKRDNGEINFTQFAKDVLRIFKSEATQGTLSAYLNINNEKSQETHRNFEKAKFNIPHKKIVS
ncbi:MAG: hypothetical protein ACYCZ2_04500 [Lutibacter sp.]